MSRTNTQKNKGLASVFGVVLILILVLTLASLLFLSLYSYEEKAEESIAIEEQRAQEKIVLLSLSTQNISGTEYLKALLINNTGTIASRVRAIYIDSNYICDPTNQTLNPTDTYINPKDSLWIQLPGNLTYSPLSKIQAATERGTKTVEYEWKLKSGSQAPPPSDVMRTNFGPLLLDFEKFYYTENDGSYNPNTWKPGWSVEKGRTVVWNVTVTDIDDRDITINKYSGFTLVSNDGGVQKPWFIEPPNGMDTLLIPSNTTAHLIYIWDRPRQTPGVSNQSVYQQNDRSKVFLTFFGIFHERDGTTKPYGQTIPFEAVLVRDPQMAMTATPATLAAGSAMTSAISVTVRDVMGLLAPNVTVSFTTTLGTLSSSTAITDVTGVATVRLSPGTTLGTATVTATWGSLTKTVNVAIVLGTLTLTANPTIVAAGSTMTSTVTARTTLNGNPLAGETVSFTTDLGSISPTAITNSQGYASATFTPGATAGIATITASWGALTQTTQINIFNTITVAPATATRTAGQTLGYTATASDGLGNNWPITNQVTWSIDSGAGGSWNGASYASAKAGTWTVKATLGGIEGTATLTVDHAAATSITVAPTTAILTAGQSQAYSATAHDTYSNTWDITSLVTWSIDQSGHGGTWVQPTGTYVSYKSGTWTVRATSAGLSGTSALTVNPAAASALIVTGFPNPTTAGTSGTVTVTAKDPYGNTATSYTGTVQFESTDTQAVLPTNYVFTSGDQGTHTFTATLQTIGTQSITATDTVTATITGSQTGIQVNPAAASTLVVEGYPSPTTAGDPHAFTVTARDLYGNTATGYRGTVRLTSTDTQAVLPPDYTFTAGDSGTKTFTNAILETAGTQSITATDTAAGTITGSQTGITVVADVLDHITITPSDSTITAGDFQTYSAEAFDAYGNSRGDVTATTSWSASGGAGGSWNGAIYTSEFAGTWTITGTYDTVQDTASLTVNPASPIIITVAPSTVTLTAGQSQTYTATAGDSLGNTWDVTAQVTAADGWSITPGAGGSWTGATYTSESAGEWTVTATLGSLADSASLTVNAASATAVTVSPATATTVAGDSQTFTASANDQYGNSWDVTNTAVWSINSGSGTYTWTSNSVQVTLAGTWTVTATYSSLSGTASLTVNPAAATQLMVTAPSAVTAGAAFSVTVTAEDQYGNVARGYTGTISFASSDAQAVLPANYAFVAGDLGTKTFPSVALKTAGTQSITATDTVSGSITGSQSGITVNPAILSYITISPPSASIIAGSTQAFTVEAFDDYGNSLGDVTTSTTWGIDAGAGGSFTGATYNSQYAGVWTVTGTYGGVDDAASLTVNHASATSISISPSSSVLTAGQSQSYTATASDAYGNTWDATAEVSAAIGWSIDTGAGGSWTGATYTSEFVGLWTITATLGGASGTSSLQVNST